VAWPTQELNPPLLVALTLTGDPRAPRADALDPAVLSAVVVDVIEL
jgi:hypothetical protein